MNIDLISGQIAKIHIMLETAEPYELYGGTTRGAFSFEHDGETWHVIAREEAVAGVPLCNYDIYARELATGREWVILSGKIIVKPRTASVPADKLHPVEYFVTVPVRNEQVDAAGNVIVQGIPGPKGERGEKGEPGEGGMTAEERALLMGAAQRDADNTFTAGNTFTGAVDMSGAQVTPPADWNVEELTPEAIQQVVPMAWVENTVTPLKTSGSIAIGSGTKTVRNNVAIGLNADAKDVANAIGWNSIAEPAGQSLGNGANTGMRGIAIGHYAKSGDSSSAIGAQSESDSYSVSLGDYAKASKSTSIAIGAQFTETVDGQNVTHTCTTEGTGSITIGAGANTLNYTGTDGTVAESSNAITIGCKAENKGNDSVVIGASATSKADDFSKNSGSVVIGAGAKHTGQNDVVIGKSAKNKNIHSVAIGAESVTDYYAVSIGYISGKKLTGHSSVSIGSDASANFRSNAIGSNSFANGECSVAIGFSATAADLGATVIRSTAEDGTYTQLYFSGANTPLANTYENGEAMMGYVVRDSAGNIMTDAEGNAMVGTQKLSVLFPNNRGENAFTPAMLSMDEDWTPKPMFRPSDLDMPTEEPQEPQEYTPLPVYPIVEPEIEPFTE